SSARRRIFPVRYSHDLGFRRVLMRCTRVAALILAVASLASVSFAAPIFSDNFNSGASSASYSTITSDLPNSFPTYGYDYSVLGIPSAPHSGDSSTRGLRLDANYGAVSAEAVNVVTLASYSGKYVVQFDAWINVNGPFPA